ncbi:DUF4190 domain-containing protein [Siphonobacter sp. SORGH_AS_0500]|uniref:DUF4190 domain-containing protein n=1 Tax=Siphonobacter sp. SORGH_AS_0500 TaxID=1864824 RepID=UPI0028605345|nr:DUF4190 domain-containing protein [Siphonobacter sp. SORGH_AS_0500]MDR6196282.1 hypothetical protein [Siphonobacter sp. SORGH_AS_0500]
MKKLFTLGLLCFLGLSACHKPSYTYFAKSTAPAFERKQVTATEAKPISFSSDSSTVEHSFTASSANSLPLATSVTPLENASTTKVTSGSITRKRTSFQQKLITKLVLKKSQRLEKKIRRAGDYRKNDTIAVIAFAAGALALLDGILIGTGVLFLLGMLTAIICGFVGLGRINRHERDLKGRGFAIAGLVLGFLELLILIIAIIVLASWSL